jgi:hypothetical protein
MVWGTPPLTWWFAIDSQVRGGASHKINRLTHYFDGCLNSLVRASDYPGGVSNKKPQVKGVNQMWIM